MTEKNEGATKEKSISTSHMWLASAVILYLFSTITLIKGLRDGVTIGMTVGEVDVNPTFIFLLGLAGAIVTQLIQTAGLLQWKKMGLELKAIILNLITIDFLAIFIAVGGLTNLIWIINNAGTPFVARAVHYVGLAFQVTLAFLGSYGAEVSFRMYLDSSGTTVRDLFQKKEKVKRSTIIRRRSSKPVYEQSMTHHHPHSGEEGNSVPESSYTRHGLWIPKKDHVWIYKRNNMFKQVPKDLTRPASHQKFATEIVS